MKSLCILRLSAIGDVCHAAAMVNRIQSTRPDIAITWIIGKIEYQLLKNMTGIRFVVFDKHQGSDAYRQLKTELQGTCFDVLFVMQVALRANWAAKQIRAKQKLGFDWHRSKELHWLFANRRIARQQHAHVLDGFMGFADAIGIPKQDKPAWRIPIPDTDTRWADQQAQALGAFAIISPAASKDERNWLTHRYAKTTDYLVSRGMRVVFCGGPTDREKKLAATIQGYCQQASTNLVGKTSLTQLLALLSHARLVIAPDTGPAHMATTVGTPVVGLYAHSNPRRTGPYNDQHRVVSVYDQVIKEQTGKPWQSLPWGTRAKGNDLMARISYEQVKQQVDCLLEQQGVSSI